MDPPCDLNIEAIHSVDCGAKHHAGVGFIWLRRVVFALQFKVEAPENDGHHHDRLHQRELVAKALARPST